MRKSIGTGLVLCLLLAQALAAATVRETLERFEFFGRWAARCDKPALPDNSLRTVYVRPDGRIEFTESLGGGYEPNTYAVIEARVTKADTVLLLIDLNGETRQDLTMRRNGGRIRTINNRRSADGTFVVKNGIVTATGQPTPWLSHCAELR